MIHDLDSSQNQFAINSPNFGDNHSENPVEALTKSLSQLKDSELHLELQNRVAEERKLTHQILRLIIEIDQRKLYFQALRLVQKKDKTQVLPIIKKELLAKPENKTGSESELILAQEFELPLQTQVKQKVQRDESARVELTYSKEQMETLTRAKELLSHALPGATLTEVISSLAERYVKQRPGVKTQAKQQDLSSLIQDPNSATEVTTRQTSSQKPVPLPVKKAILSSNEGCQFKDPKTGRLCGSKHFQQVDHIQARFAGGGNEPTNLRVLCSSHNRYRYTAGC